ncbi:MAG: AAA family ATPase [Deltaproteobacteria bacterium]|nr:AAA family ATPase [Deltaproteobacteria bacterium]
MEPPRLMKYNPAFLDDEALIASFVVRRTDLELILEVVEENSGPANQHHLVIGPRGSGKTTLVRRVAAEVRRRPDLQQAWYPLMFGEDSYEVASAGQFWLEALHFLGEQTGQASWREAYLRLREEPKEEDLRHLALSKLLDFADQENKRILLVVENLNLVLGEQVPDDDAWKLRHTLLNEPRTMLLGTATARFDQIDNSGQALYETFRLHELRPLEIAECQAVWRLVTGHDLLPSQARAINILTGGNPRLLTILSNFGANRSFQSLMEDLTFLVDDHTDYFKSNMESLPPVERKVFACLATLWEDSTAAQVATAARLTPSKASALLGRLVQRGAVAVVSDQKRKKTYQLAERLYNIFCLMRRGQDSERVRAVVHFMVQFYGGDHLTEAAADIAREACGLEPAKRRLSYLALEEILSLPMARDNRFDILLSLPEELFSMVDLPESLQVTGEDNLKALTSDKPDFPEGWFAFGTILSVDYNRRNEAEYYLLRAIELKPEFAQAWSQLGILHATLFERPEDGEAEILKSLEINPDIAISWARLAVVQSELLGRHEEGERNFRKALLLDDNMAMAWYSLGYILAFHLEHFEEGEECLRKAVKLDAGLAIAWRELGRLLLQKSDSQEDGKNALRKSIELQPDNLEVWSMLLILEFSNSDDSFALKALLEEYLQATKRLGAASLINLANTLLGADDPRYLPEIESWSREAIAKDSTKKKHHAILANALAFQGKASEALQELAIPLKEVELIKHSVNPATETLAAIAAAGQAEAALELLEESPSALVLEPVVVALKMYLGQEPSAPQEVREVAKDVVQRIEAWRERLAG